MRKENHGDLEAFLDENKASCFSERAAKYAVESVLLALADMQDLSLFHRDVKLKNFVVAGWTNFNETHEIKYDSNNCLDIKV